MIGPSTTTVAQQISNDIEDQAESGYQHYAEITEVGAELKNRDGDETSLGHPYSQFTVKTSDGQEWTVRVTPKPVVRAAAYGV